MDSVLGTRPAVETRIDVPLVRRLVAAQFPQWASLAVEPVESAGWDNAIFRLGSGLAARLPRRRIGAQHVSDEHQWLPVLAAHLPLAIPIPVGRGVPGEGYLRHWTVCPWLAGELAAPAPVADMGRAATSLARFIAALQSFDPTGGSVHEFRGVCLAAHDHSTRSSAAVLRDSLDVSPVLRGDPACDLMVAWTYLSADCREGFRVALAVDDATWCRGRGWALQFGLRAAASSADNPVLADMGRYTLAEVLADFEQAHS